jgi:uncharacterized protein YlxW (UPF0749 family)
MERIDWIITIAVVILLALFVFDRAVFADEIAAATDVVSVTDTLRLQTENAELKQQVQLLSAEVQALSLRVASQKCAVAENYLFFATIHQALTEAMQANDWDRVRRVLLLLFDVIHRWGKE